MRTILSGILVLLAISPVSAGKRFDADTMMLAARRATALELLVPPAAFLKSIRQMFPRTDSIGIRLLPYSRRKIILEVRPYGAFWPKGDSRGRRMTFILACYLTRTSVNEDAEFFSASGEWTAELCRGARCEPAFDYRRNGPDKCMCTRVMLNYQKLSDLFPACEY